MVKCCLEEKIVVLYMPELSQATMMTTKVKHLHAKELPNPPYLHPCLGSRSCRGT